MKTIYKYNIQATTTFDMTQGAKPLCVQMQDDVPMMWVELDPDAPLKLYQVLTIGTGWGIPDGYLQHAQYVGTYQTAKGLVFHIYLKDTK